MLLTSVLTVVMNLVVVHHAPMSFPLMYALQGMADQGFHAMGL